MMQIKNRGQLPHLLRHFNLPLTAAEVGTAEGRYSEELLDNGIELLYLIDIWEETPCIQGCASFSQEWHDANYNRVVKLFGNNPKVVILKGFSHKQARFINDNSLGLVYIDAGHDYTSVKSDIQIWYPKLCDGGILAFHDYNDQYGVKRALVEFMRGEGGINLIVEDGNTENQGAWIRKQ